MVMLTKEGRIEALFLINFLWHCSAIASLLFNQRCKLSNAVGNGSAFGVQDDLGCMWPFVR